MHALFFNPGSFACALDPQIKIRPSGSGSFGIRPRVSSLTLFFLSYLLINSLLGAIRVVRVRLGQRTPSPALRLVSLP